MKRIIQIFLLSLLILSCNKKTDFLYLTTIEEAPKLHIESKKVKEMDGNDKVDILWVIDNSASMDDEHQNLILNTGLFISQFTSKSSVDWKMGIISTDIGDSPYLGFSAADQFNVNTKDPVPLFKTAVSHLGTNGSGYEKTYDPMVKHLNSYPDFIRPGAYLALIILTDEDEQSSLSPQQALSYLRQLKGDLSLVLGYGVFSTDELSCPDGFKYQSSQYKPFLDGLKNTLYPLCDVQFGQNLAALGADIVQYIQNKKFPLSDRPKPGTLKVIYKGKEINPGPSSKGGYWIYDYELNTVIFTNLSFAPGNEEEVQIQYETVS